MSITRLNAQKMLLCQGTCIWTFITKKNLTKIKDVKKPKPQGKPNQPIFYSILELAF